MTEPENGESIRIVYHGRVQGVGFRFTVSRIATAYPVTGYVKNLRNGTVELVVQGSPADVSEFTDEISRVMKRNITDSPREVYSGGETFSQFSIRR